MYICVYMQKKPSQIKCQQFYQKGPLFCLKNPLFCLKKPKVQYFVEKVHNFFTKEPPVEVSGL